MRDNDRTIRIALHGEHTAMAGRVYCGDDPDDSDDFIVVERDSRERMIELAAEWASRSGAVNAYTIRCGRAILDHLGVPDEDGAAGVIEDLGLDLGSASMEYCRAAIDLSDDEGTLTPEAMAVLASDPKRHSYSTLREALIMLGCVEQSASEGGAA